MPRKVKPAERVSVSKLLGYLPQDTLNAIAAQTQVDHQVMKLNGVVFPRSADLRTGIRS